KCETYVLTDGSRITTEFIILLKEQLGVDELQCIISMSKKMDILTFLYSGRTTLSKANLLQAVSSLNADLALSEDQSRYISYRIKKVPIDRMLTTLRQKRPLIIQQ